MEKKSLEFQETSLHVRQALCEHHREASGGVMETHRAKEPFELGLRR